MLRSAAFCFRNFSSHVTRNRLNGNRLSLVGCSAMSSRLLYSPTLTLNRFEHNSTQSQLASVLNLGKTISNGKLPQNLIMKWQAFFDKYDNSSRCYTRKSSDPKGSSKEIKMWRIICALEPKEEISQLIIATLKELGEKDIFSQIKYADIVGRVDTLQGNINIGQKHKDSIKNNFSLLIYLKRHSCIVKFKFWNGEDDTQNGILKNPEGLIFRGNLMHQVTRIKADPNKDSSTCVLVINLFKDFEYL